MSIKNEQVRYNKIYVPRYLVLYWDYLNLQNKRMQYSYFMTYYKLKILKFSKPD